MHSNAELTLEEKKSLLRERLQSKNKTYALASPAQQALWSFTLANPTSHAYHLKFTARIKPPISKDILEQSLNTLVKRHAVLHSRFVYKDDKLFEVFDQHNPLTLVMNTVTEETLAAAILQDYASPFDLKKGPLLRGYLYTLENTEQVLLLVVHHIVLDGLSLLHLVRELGELVAATANHIQPILPELKYDYIDYLQYQANLLNQPHLQASATYWRDNLSTASHRLNLPYDTLRNTAPSFMGGSYLQIIDNEKVTLLKKLASQHQLTMNALLLGIYQLTLISICTQNTVLCATPSLGRSKPEFLSMIGYFANMMVIRADANDDLSLLAFLAQTKQTLFSAVKHQDYPFVRLIKELDVQRELTQLPLVQAAFAFHQPLANSRGLDISLKLSQNENLQWGHSLVAPFRIGQTACQFDLYLIALEASNGNIHLSFEYMNDVFHADTIQKISQHYLAILDIFINDVNQPITHLPSYKPYSEYEDYVLNVYNNSDKKVNFNSLAQQLLDSVKQNRTNIAVVDQQGSYSYDEVLRLSFSIAEVIKSNQRKPNQAIGILLEKGVMQVASVLGVLFSGNYFIPLHTDLPINRLNTIIDNADIELLITHRDLFEKHASLTVKILDVGTVSPRDDFSIVKMDVSAIAYVIYTSGTTGIPKGVVISQQSLLNTVLAINEKFNITAVDKAFAISDLSFDLAMYDVFGMLLAGGSLVFCAMANIKEPKAWLTLIEQHQVTLWNSVPMLFAMLLKQSVRPLPFKHVFLSGDWINVELVTQGFSLCPSANIISLGGPTETTIWSIHYPLARNTSYEFIPYGFPLPNHRYYVLNEDLKLCPVNQTGEIYAGGMGLALGYLNDDVLTDNAFIMHPRFGRIYRTGDLGVMTKDVGIRIKGRCDRQVKIGGHRIELEDVRLALEQCFSGYVITCHVVGDKRLVAYIEASQPILGDYQWIENIENDAKLKSCYHLLKQSLPSYMIPSLFVYVAVMPLSRNGKIAYDALPNVLLKTTENNSLSIETPVENIIAEVWSKILNVPYDKLYKNSDFFQLGGDSLNAVAVIDALEKELRQSCRLQSLFENSTIEKFAQSLAEAVSNSKMSLPSIIVNTADRFKPFPLTPVQQAYWIGRQNGLDLGKVGTHSYIEFDIDKLDLDLFQQALDKTIATHDMLRVVFLKNGTQQVNENVSPYPLTTVDLRNFSSEDQDRILQQTRAALSHEVLSMQHFPVFHLSVYQLANFTRVILSYDALQFDAWSLMIFLREMRSFYQYPTKTIESYKLYYRDYVEYLANIAEHPSYITAKSYWQDRISSLPFGPELPIKTLPIEQSFKRLSGSLSKNDWDTIKTQAQKLKCTPTGLVLAVFAWVMRCYSKKSHFSLNLTLFNRLKVSSDIDNIIGDFTSLNLLEVKATPAKIVFAEFLQNLQQQLFQDLDHRLYDGVNVQRDLARFHQVVGTPIAPVVFTSTLGFVKVASENKTISAKVNYAITQTPQVWLDNQVSENAEGLHWNWDYIDGLFDSSMMHSMHAHYEFILKNLVNESWDNYYLPAVSKQYLDHLAQFNQTDKTFVEKSLSVAVLSSFRNNFSKAAVIDDKGETTYANLFHSAFGLAKKIESYNLSKGSAIGILLEKGVGQVVACLGILFSGHYFVPLNIANPKNRLNVLIKEAAISLLISDNNLIERFGLNDKMALDIQAIIPTEHQHICEVDAKQTAYVIYTSGSTGTPKGVVISHRSVLNTLYDINERYRVNSTDKVLALSDLSFDLAIYDIFGLLLAGGTIVFPQQALTKEPSHWLSLIEKHQISLWNSVPMLFAMLLFSEPLLPSLKTVMLSGDWISPELITKGFKRCEQATFAALGGATECSIWSNSYLLQRDLNYSFIPYGFPLTNQKFYILHDDLSICPEGIEGELYIGGVGLATGYYQDEKKTQTAFINHPELGRLYYTGDWGVMTESFGIKFLGRKDAQVKIGGYRIELNEVEQALKRTLPIDELLLDVQGEQNDKQLIAYCVMPDTDIQKKEQQLARMNIRKFPDDATRYPIEALSVTHADWFNRKSYRKWLPSSIDFSLIKACFSSIKKQSPVYDKNKQSLFAALNLLTAIENDSNPVPKYLYPSAGGLYPVQCYLSIASNLLTIPKGCYYFSPLNRELVKISDQAMHDSDEVYLIADSDLIRPFYKTSWPYFCEIEAGHMAALLSQHLHLFMADKKINREQLQLTPSHVVISQFLLWQVDGLHVSDISYSLLNQNQKIKNIPVDHTVSSMELDVWGDTAKILQSAAGVLLFDKEQSGFALGWHAQQWMENAAKNHIGCCYLGNLVEKNSVDNTANIGIAFGLINKAMLDSREISSNNASKQSLLQEVYARLKSELPAYMLPSQFIFLDKIPLSANGKVDKSALPKANTKALEQHEPIVSPFEKVIAAIWSEVLHIPVIDLNRQSDFFALGGHSLKALEMLSLIEIRLHIIADLKSIFKAAILKDFSEQLKLYQINSLYEASRFVTLKEVSSDSPMIILIHPSTGTIDCYVSLSTCFNEHYNLVAIQYKNSLAENLQQLASEYANDVMQNFRHKKIHLLGYSLGAHIAFEMAKVFEANQFAYESLACLDAIPIIESDALFYETNDDMNVFEHVLKNDYGISEEKLPLFIRYMTERQNAVFAICNDYLTVGKLNRPIAYFKANEVHTTIKSRVEQTDILKWNDFTNSEVVKTYDIEGNHMNILAENHVHSFLHHYHHFLLNVIT